MLVLRFNCQYITCLCVNDMLQCSGICLVATERIFNIRSGCKQCLFCVLCMLGFHLISTNDFYCFSFHIFVSNKYSISLLNFGVCRHPHSTPTQLTKKGKSTKQSEIKQTVLTKTKKNKKVYENVKSVNYCGIFNL